MSWDIHGNPLARGHCEVHPLIAEGYPCSACVAEDRRRDSAREAWEWEQRARAAEAKVARARNLVSDWQANSGSRALGDPTAETWLECADQLLTALGGDES